LPFPPPIETPRVGSSSEEPDVGGIEEEAAATIVHIILFTPKNLYTSPTPPYAFRTSPVRRVITGTWENFGRFISRSVEGDAALAANIAKRARGALVVGRYADRTGYDSLLGQFLGSRILAIDVDSGDPHRVAHVCRSVRAYVSSTYRSTVATPHCRLFPLLDREITTPDEYSLLVYGFARVLTHAGFTIDVGASSLGHLAFLPMHQKASIPTFIETGGYPVPVDRWLARAREVRAADPTTTPRVGSTSPSTPLRVWESESQKLVFVGRALESAAQNILSAAEGSRHETTQKELLKLAHPQKGITEDEIISALEPAWQKATGGIREAEFRSLCRWAIPRGRVPR
jgi:hypothetical protein